MALVVTPGASDADSYLSVAAADARASESDDGPERDAWLATPDERRERLLRRATAEIDMYLEPAWPRYAAGQALQFPRSVDVTGSTPYIPASVQVACYQQAIYLAKNVRVLAAANVRRQGTDGSEEGDGFGVDPAAGPSVLSPLATLALARFRKAAGTASSRGVGTVRMSAGYAGGS